MLCVVIRMWWLYCAMIWTKHDPITDEIILWPEEKTCDKSRFGNFHNHSHLDLPCLSFFYATMSVAPQAVCVVTVSQPATPSRDRTRTLTTGLRSGNWNISETGTLSGERHKMELFSSAWPTWTNTHRCVFMCPKVLWLKLITYIYIYIYTIYMFNICLLKRQVN